MSIRINPIFGMASFQTDANLITLINGLNVNDENEEAFEDEAHKEFRASFASAHRLRMSQLKGYDVPEKILTVERSKGSLGAVTSKDLTRLFDTMDISIETGYKNAFSTMIHFEEAAQSQYLIQFNTENLKITYSSKGREFRIANDAQVAAMAEAAEESILDCFTLIPRKSPNVSLGGQVKGCNKEFIFIEITEKEHSDYLRANLHQFYDIIFHVNRVPFQLQHYALEWIESHRLFNVLLNNPKFEIVDFNLFGTQRSNELIDENYVFSGQLGPKLNREQKIAAVNIIQARNMPLPYLLFGPAGTGKTRTLIAAIEEIVRSTNKYVLVCANSNSACDEIAERLVNVLEFGEMFRMYAKSYDVRKISSNLKPICNWLKGEFHFPSMHFLNKFRVLVCTLTTAGCLSRARDDPYFSATHFSHIFIDESASTHEPITMIPIAGLCTSIGSIHSSIVLAGDPKQLDAVTKSDYATKFGYNTSLMERLYGKPLYKRNPTTGNYNQMYITQLVKNYRSHSAILHIPNVLFYENKLEAMASSDITDWFIGSKLLPSKNFPIIFKSVLGLCKKSEKDFSMFNQKEVEIVIDYIKKLLANDGTSKKAIAQSDIGVVTPYKLQCKFIARACRRNNFNNITVGTAEVFQGQERPVMIVSTVRTGGTLGFLKDPRRLNVIITRAKCLLIIVGDHRTLQMDPNWHKLLYYCYEKNAIIQ